MHAVKYTSKNVYTPINKPSKTYYKGAVHQMPSLHMYPWKICVISVYGQFMLEGYMYISFFCPSPSLSMPYSPPGVVASPGNRNGLGERSLPSPGLLLPALSSLRAGTFNPTGSLLPALNWRLAVLRPLGLGGGGPSVLSADWH